MFTVNLNRIPMGPFVMILLTELTSAVSDAARINEKFRKVA
jgi:hypothetical protein